MILIYPHLRKLNSRAIETKQKR